MLKTKLPRNRTIPLSWSKTDVVYLFLIGVGAVIAILRFWQPGISSEADMLMGIYRIFELNEAWSNGIVYPRIGPNLNFGLGAPLFQFYPPLASYFALGFFLIGFGFIGATKAVVSLGLLLAGVGMYIYSRWLFNNRLAAFMATVAYIFAPYLLLTVYERGAVAEFLALALLPWVFWTTHRLLCAPTRIGWLVASAVTIALLILAHNITALFSVPFLFLYLMLIAWQQKQLKNLRYVSIALGLGFCLSAFYWLPALLEMRYTKVEAHMLGEAQSTKANLYALSNLIQHSLISDYWGEMRFHLSLWQAFIGIVTAILLALVPSYRRLQTVILFVLWIVLMFVQSELSRVLWETVPLVRFIQFPWRLLGLTSFTIALLAGSLIQITYPKRQMKWMVTLALLILIVWSTMAQLKPELSSVWSNITEKQITKTDLFRRGRLGFPLFEDYAPIWMKARSFERTNLPSVDSPASVPLASYPDIKINKERFDQIDLSVRTETPFTFTSNRIFFPGWKAYIDGQSTQIYDQEPFGVVAVDLPAGNYQVLVRFENTPIRWIAIILSTIALLIIVMVLLKSQRGRKRLALFVILLVLSGSFLLLYHSIAKRNHYPTAYAADFNNEIRLLGYQIVPNTWKPGEEMNLILYWFVQDEPDSEYKTFIHIVAKDDSEVIEQVDSLPNLGYYSTKRWKPGELIVDEYTIKLDKSSPPGQYFLLVGLYHPDTVQNLPVKFAPNILPGDRVVLTEIEIQGD